MILSRAVLIESVFHRRYLTVVSRMCHRMDIFKNSSGILIINQHIWHAKFRFIYLLTVILTVT